MTRRWVERTEALVAAYPRLLGVSVWRCLQAEGFAGCYAMVTRELRRIRGPRFSVADQVSVPIHTDPGEEAQFDWANLDAVARRWGWEAPLRCFGMILCWSRRRIWWFTTSEDRQCTFEGMVRFFEAVGGVPAVCRCDRMGALGSSQGSRFVLAPPVVGFAAHHHTRITSCRAGDAKRKGKVCECEDRVGAVPAWPDPGKGLTVVSFVRFVGRVRCCACTRAGRADLTS